MSLERPPIIKDYLNLDNSKVHYLSFGQGKELLICFHGFGDRANMFLALAPSLSLRFKVFAIDLPFHGHTQWTTDRFDKQDIITIIQKILKKESKQQFSLMGFSFGGRVVQSLLKDFENQLQSIFLIAPDGLQTKGMLNAFLVPQPLRYLIKTLVENPTWFISVMDSFQRIGLVSKFTHNFTVNHVSTKERRERVFCFWLSLNDFKLRKKKVKQQLKKMNVPVYLFFGKGDEVVPISAGEWMAEGMTNVQLFILEKKHLLVGKELDGVLNQELNMKLGEA